MRKSGHRGAAIATALLATILVLAQPSPPEARANVGCELATSPAGAITGAVGLGNPVGDACNKVTNAVTGAVTAPVNHLVSGALKGLGSDVFGRLTAWVSEGAGWLMGKVVRAIDSSTTPHLETEGFLLAYGRMAAIAAVMACAMLLLAVLEGIAQGNPGLLARVVLVNVPLAFLGTSVAFAVVQLLIGATDGLSAAIAGASHHDSTRFFEVAIDDLGHLGGQVGKEVGSLGGQAPSEGLGTQAAGSVAMPLFVGFLAAIVGAFAAFFVWLELLMRDAAVYAVALFMPLALAAGIWPRWTGALRRTGEILVAVIGSKFVIVAIVSLAAGLLTEESGSVEHVLAAAALMCLACFAPFVLLRLIPFSEGALAAAYGRRSAAGGAIGGVQIASDVQMIRNMGRSGAGGSGGGAGVSLWGAEEGGAPPGGGATGGGGPGSAGTPGPGGPGGGRGPGGPGGPGPAGGPAGAAAGGAARGGGGGSGAGREAGGAAAGAEAAGGSGPAAAAAAPLAAAGGARRGAEALASTASAQVPQSRSGGGEESAGDPGPARGQGDPAPTADRPSETGAEEAGGSPTAPGERPPRPEPEPRPGEGDGSGDGQ